MTHVTRGALAAGLALAALTMTGADAPAPSAKEQLGRLQGVVGAWKGVGQPQRGSTKGSWSEQAEWAWQFGEGQTALVAKLGEGKYFQRLALSAGREANRFDLAATLPDGKTTVQYRGDLADDRLQLAGVDLPEGAPARITLRFAGGGDRLLILYERRTGGDQFFRLAEVGYTRQGSNFGKGSSGPECIVTGGVGTMPVTYEGKTYYVCCTGCRDYFNENPAKALAEYQARKAEEAKQGK